MKLTWIDFKSQKREIDNITIYDIYRIISEERFEFSNTQREGFTSSIYSKKFKEFDLSLRYWIRCFAKNKIEFFYVDYKCLQKIFSKYWKFIKLGKRKIDNIEYFRFYNYLNTILVYEETERFREFPVLQSDYLSRNYLRYITQELDGLSRRGLRWSNTSNNNFTSERSKNKYLKSLGLAFTYTWTKEESYKNITWKKDIYQIKNEDLISVSLNNNSTIFEFFATPFGVLIWKEYKNKPNNITKILECYEYEYN